MHDRKHHFNYIQKPLFRQALIYVFCGFFYGFDNPQNFHSLSTQEFVIFLFPAFPIFLYTQLFTFFYFLSIYPQNVDKMWITYTRYSHFSFLNFLNALFLKVFRHVDDVFYVIHIIHIFLFPHHLS